MEKDLEKEYGIKAKGAQIRSRIKWIEEGEKNTNYFLSLEKQRQLIKIHHKTKRRKWKRNDRPRQNTRVTKTILRKIIYIKMSKQRRN